MQKITIISPVYNEEGNIIVFYDTLLSVLKSLTKFKYDIIFVDDGSNDQSPLLLAKIAHENRNVKVLTFSRNFGHQAAITAGIENTDGDAVIILDSDLQDPPAVIPSLVQKWQEGYEVVNAKRHSRQDSWLKATTAMLFYRTLNAMLTNKIPENVGDYRLLDKKCVQILKTIQEKDRYLRGLSTWIGFKQCEVEYDRDKRFSGSTHYTLSKMFNLAFDAIFSFSKLPMRMALFSALMFLIANVLIIIYTLISWFTGHVVAGWTSVVFVISFLGSLQMFVLAIISEYVGRIYTQTQNRPLYIIAQKTNC